MTPRDPHPVASPVVARVAVARGRRYRHRVLGHEIGRVPDAIAAVHHPPRELDPLVDEAVKLRPAAHLVEDPPRHRNGPLPDERHLAGLEASRAPQARHPVARPNPTLARLDAQLHEPDVGLRIEHPRQPGERVGRHERSVVVEEEEELAAHLRHPGVATGRNAAVYREPHTTDTGGQPGWLPRVAHHDDVHVDALLPQQRVERQPQHVRPPALGQDHTPEGGGHRRRCDVRIAARWPTAVITPAATSATSRTRVAPRPPRTSSITAATKISSVLSTATNAR